MTVKHSGLIALAAFGVGMALAPAAMAGDANFGTCVHMAKQVTAAIAAAQPGPAKDQAQTAADSGRDFCAASMYTQGVANYQKALQLLGKS